MLFIRLLYDIWYVGGLVEKRGFSALGISFKFLNSFTYASYILVCAFTLKMNFHDLYRSFVISRMLS